MSEQNTANNLSSLAAAFSNPSQPSQPSQPAQPAQQQENQITYNNTFDPTTDAYGAPIQQPNAQPNAQPNQPAPQQPNNQPNNPNQPNQQPSLEDQNLINQLFDDNVQTISLDPDNSQQQPTNVFDQLAATIAAATNQQQQQQSDTNPVTAVFNESYGEDIDFSTMMADSGDPEEINKNMQVAVREKMEAVYTGAITQSIALAQQLVDRKLTEFTETIKTQQTQQQAQTTLNQKLPFTTKPEYSGLSQMLLSQAMKKTNNNAEQSVQLVEKIFRLNNPALFDKPNNTRFGVPTPNGNSGPAELTLDSIDAFLN